MRKKRKKSFSVFLLTVLGLTLTATMTGCHGQKEKTVFEVPENFDSSSQYEITFWAKNDTNKRQTDIYKQAIADFEQIYPNITVQLKLYTDYGKIYNDVITNIGTDTTPNVCITYPDHIATYISGSNQVVPLDDLLNDPKFGLGGNEIVPQFLEECRIQGHIYAVPFMRSTEACYINKTYVEALGYEIPEQLTWDFVWEVSEAAMKKDAEGNFLVNGQKVMIPFIYKSTDNMMIQMLKQQNARYSNASGEILIFQDETKEILKTVAKHVKTGAFSTFKISSYPANFLNAGQCIFAIDSTAGATWMGTEAPLLDIAKEDIVEFETVVMPIPQFDVNQPKMISQGPSICIFNKEDTQEVLASWLFVQHLLSNDVQIAYSQTEGYVPVTVKAQESSEYRDYLARAGEDNDLYYNIKIEASKILLKHVGDTFITPVFNGSTSLREASGQMIENTAKSVRRKQAVDDAYFDALFADMISLYRLDQIETVDGGKADLGPLPSTAKKLLGLLATAWVFIIGYVVYGQIKKKE